MSLSFWRQAGGSNFGSSPLMGEFPFLTTRIPFIKAVAACGVLQREVGRPVLLPALALEEAALFEVGKEGEAIYVLPKPPGAAEPRECQARHPDVSMGDVHECDGTGLALGVKHRWDSSQSPTMLMLYLFTV